MSSEVHPTAIVDPSVVLGDGVRIGPYCLVGPGVTLGAGVDLSGHVVVEGPTVLEPRVRVHPFAVLGAAPQDRSYAGEPTTLHVGEGTVIREHVTVHRGTRKDRGHTSIGARCLLMVGVHVAHDATVGDDCTLANGVQISGHVVLEEAVTVGGLAAFAPFVRVGTLAFVAAGARVEHDVPPYHVAQGDRARVRSLNVVGLARHGVPDAALQAAHRTLYRAGLPQQTALARLASAADPHVQRLVAFLSTHTTLPGPSAVPSARDQ